MRQNNFLRLVPLLLLVALTFSLSRGSVSGQQAQKCGDSICGGNENCLMCRQDCGACSAAKKCGDGLCHINEGENSENCPKDCPVTEEKPVRTKIVEEVICGDNICSLEGEDCTTCLEDCGECSYSLRSRIRAAFRRVLRLAQRLLGEQGAKLSQDARIFLQGSLAAIENQKRLMGEHALERSEAAEQLMEFLTKNEDISRHLTTFDARLIKRMSDREHANVLTTLPALHLRSKIRRVTLAERATMVELTQEMIRDPQAQELLRSMPETETVFQAVAAGDLTTIARILPAPPASDLPAILKKLQELQDLLGPEFSKKERSTLFSLLIASAQEPAEIQQDSSLKDAFRDSVQLTQHLREVARDADAALPSLEERLTYLEGRRAILAGVVHLQEDDVGKNLDRIQREAGSHSTQSLLNLVGIFRYLRSTENFMELEHAMSDALSHMRFGVRKVRALFARSGTPQAEAALLLRKEWKEEQVSVLERGDDMETQREVIKAFLAEERKQLEQGLLSHLPSEKKQEFVEKMLALEANALATADSPTELRAVLAEIRALILDAQTNARAQRTVLFRLFDPLQDFLL